MIKMGDGGWDTYSLALLNQQCTQVIYTSLFLFKVMQIGAALHCERNKIPRMDFPSFVSYQEDFESMKILKGLEGRQYMKIFMRNDPVMAYSGHFQDVVNATNDDLITHAIQNLAIPYNLGQLTQKLGWECHSLLPWIKDNTNPINLTSFSF